MVKPDTRTQYIKDLKTFYKIFRDPTIKVQDVVDVSSKCVMVTTKDVGPSYRVSPTSTLIVGAVSSASVRLTQLTCSFNANLVIEFFSLH